MPLPPAHRNVHFLSGRLAWYDEYPSATFFAMRDMIDVLITHVHEKTPVMDIETEEWPILAKHKAEFESMKFKNMACPLRAYRDNVFMEPRNVNEALTDAMIKKSEGARKKREQMGINDSW